MDSALLLLIRLRARGTIRRMFRRVRGVRGAIALAAGLLVFILWLAPSLVTLFTRPHAPADPINLNGPAALLALCLLPLLTGQSIAIAFIPAEIDILFAGPFTRRQLITYKVLTNTLSAAVLAVFLAVWLARMAGSWLAPFPMAFLTLILAQLCGMAIALVGAIVGRRILTATRRALLILALGAAATVAWRVVGPSTADLGTETLARLRDSLPARILLAPFSVFIHMLTAPSAAAIAAWGLAAAAIDAAVFTLVIFLDRHAAEAALAASQRLADMRERARRGHIGASSAWIGRWTLPWPAPPRAWLGGAGPTAWRQATTCLRRAPGWMLSTFIMLAAVLGFGLWTRLGKPLPPDLLAVIATQVVVMLTVFQTVLLRFDFRADIDRMESLKALPVRPFALAAGQIAAPVLFMTLSQWLLAAAGCALFPQGRAFFTAAALAAPGLNILLVGVENAMFLLYPTRPPTGPALDFQRVGRGMIISLAKMAAVLVVAAAVAGVGAGAYFALGRSWPAAIAAGWTALAAAAWAVTLAVARAFDNFDPSRDVA